MIKHELSLHVKETRNPFVLWVEDNSIYHEDLAVKCGRLDIGAYGYSRVVGIDTIRDFSYRLTSGMLGKSNSSDYKVIADGIYYLRYSVSPNDKAYVEYYHLRIVNFLNKYYGCMAKEDSCDFGKNRERMLQFMEAKHFAEVAKYKVEELHELEEGMSLLKKANNMIDMLCDNQCC